MIIYNFAKYAKCCSHFVKCNMFWGFRLNIFIVIIRLLFSKISIHSDPSVFNYTKSSPYIFYEFQSVLQNVFVLYNFVKLSRIVSVSVDWIEPLYYLYSYKSVNIFFFLIALDFTGTKFHLKRNNEIALALFTVWCVILACGRIFAFGLCLCQACAGVVSC